MDYTLIGFIVYLIMMIALGLITYGRNKSHEDFFLGGRQLNPWLVAFSERTSSESVWLLVGLPGAALAVGFVEIWTAIGCVGGIILSWFIIAKDLRIATGNKGSITLPDYFATLFGRNDPLIRFLSMIIIIFFFTFYLAAQFNGAGKVLNITFGLEIWQGISISAIIIIVYTMMGGFLAVVWTDMVQGILMICTLIVLPIVGIYELAESGQTIGSAISAAGKGFGSLTGGAEGWTAAALIIGGLSWGLGYLGQPHLVTKYMSIKDPQKIKISRNIAISWAIPAFTGAVLIGLIGLAMYGQGAFTDPESVMPTLATDLLPAWLAGIFISAALAAIMSTADSQLLVISSAVIEDFYHKSLGREVTHRQLLVMSRIITFVVGIAGLVVALTSKELIFSMVSYAWAGLGASFGPAILLSLKWKGCTRNGIVAGILTGAVSTVVWNNIDALSDMITVRFSSFFLAFLAIVLVSKLGGKKQTKIGR